MPQKINMFLSNGIMSQPKLIKMNTSSLASVNFNGSSKSPNSALNAPFLARVHNVRPGCGSCGRH